jgi:hypothetical protein
MANRLVIEGIDAWKDLPDQLTRQGEAEAEAAAEAAKDAVVRAYPRVTGRLQDGVIVQKGRSWTGGVIYWVKSTAPYAEIYEWGAASGNGQAAKSTFIPITNDGIRELKRELVAVVEAAGFQVIGDKS